MAEHAASEASPISTPALISFALLAIWTITVGGFFGIIILRLDVKSDLIGTLGAIISAETAAISAITGFWLASSLTANRANASKEAALTQLAGAGPPPPAVPLEPTPVAAAPAPAGPVVEQLP